MTELSILHIFRAPVGGLFRHVVDLAEEQASLGHAVGLVCDSGTGGDRAEARLAELAPKLRLGVERLAMPRLPGPGDLPVLAALSRRARAIRPDVLHGHGAKGGLYARLARAPAAVRVYTPHGGSFHYSPGTPQGLLYLACERVLAWRTDLFLFESEFIAQKARERLGPHLPSRVNPNGLRHEEFLPVTPATAAADLLFVGELRDLKGLDTLFEALDQLRRQGQRVSLLVVGAGPDEAALKARAAKLDSVTFAPPMPMREALAKGRVLVVPSRMESLPYAVLEAAAAGHPLIATKVGGLPEIFGPLAHRLIAPNDPAGLAEAISAMRDRPGAQRVAETVRLREHVRTHFAIEKMAETALRGYAEALVERSGDGSASVASPLPEVSSSSPAQP